MAFTPLHPTEPDRPVKRRIQRRHGACEPCRSSKTKCDGRIPCGACRSERRRQCPCVYSEKVMKLQQVTAEMRRRAETEKTTCNTSALPSRLRESAKQLDKCDSLPETSRQTLVHDSVEMPGRHGLVGGRHVGDDKLVFCSLSLCATVSEFKRLKSARGSSAPVIARCSGFDASDLSLTGTNVYHGKQESQSAETHLQQSSSKAGDLTASSPDIERLVRQLNAVRHTIKTGKLIRAWIDLASIVREADELRYLVRTWSDQEQLAWRRIWNRILDTESQLGLTIGRPTCLVFGKSSQHKDTLDGYPLQDDRLDATRLDLYQHIQAVLSLDFSHDSAVNQLLEKARNVLSHESFNQIGLCTTEVHSVNARDLQLNTHLLFMVVYCRLASMCDVHARDGHAPVYLGNETTDAARSMTLNQPRQKLAYCRKMFRSAKFVLSTFISIFTDEPDAIADNWLHCHSAFIAATLLGIAKLRHEVEWDATSDLLHRLEEIFEVLSARLPENQLFTVAIERLRDLNSVKEPSSEATRNKHCGIKHRKRSAPSSAVTSPQVPTMTVEMPASQESTLASPSKSMKRAANDMADFEDDLSLQTSDNAFDGVINPLSYFSCNPASYSSSSSYTSTTPTSTAGSFNDSGGRMSIAAEGAVTHPGPPFVFPFPCDSVHTPIIWTTATTSPQDRLHEEVVAQTQTSVHFYQSPQILNPTGQIDLEDLNNIRSVEGRGPSQQHSPLGITPALVSAITQQQQGLSSNGDDDNDTSPQQRLMNEIPNGSRVRRPTQTQLHHSLLQAEHFQTIRSNMDRRGSTNVTPSLSHRIPQQPPAGVWQTDTPALASDMTDMSRRASVEDVYHTIPLAQHHSAQQESFFLHGNQHMESTISDLSTHIFQPMQTTSTHPKSQFYGAADHSQLSSGHLASPLCANYDYHFHQSHDYMAAQEQWRRLAIDAGAASVVP